MHFSEPKMVIYEVVTGKRTPLIEAYPPLPPSTLEYLPNLAESLAHLRDKNIIVLGDLNADTQAQTPRSHQVAERYWCSLG